MKTPRESLLNRHRKAVPKLDRLRHEFVASLGASKAGKEQHWVVAAPATVWHQLIWPSRFAWAGLAALWLALLGANLELKSEAPRPQPGRAASEQQWVSAIQERRRLLTELLPAEKRRPAEAPPQNQGPRSQAPEAYHEQHC